MRLITDISKLWFSQTRKRAVLEQILLYAKLNHGQLNKIAINMATTQDLETALADIKTAISDAAQRVLDKLNNLNNVPDADVADIRADIEALQKIANDPVTPGDVPPPAPAPEGPTETTES